VNIYNAIILSLTDTSAHFTYFQACIIY